MHSTGQASTARLDRLRKTLQKELSRERQNAPFCSQESRHRRCALSTHKTLPATDHKIPASVKAPIRTAKRTNNTQQSCSAPDIEPIECMPATGLQQLSQLRQKAMCSSEWALLSTLDAQKAIDDAAKRRDDRQIAQMKIKQALDSQIQELQEREMEEKRQKDADKRLVDQAMLKFKTEEQERLLKLLANQWNMKNEAAVQIQEYRRKRAQKIRIKMEDESMEIKQIQHDLKLEQQRIAERKEATRSEQHQLQLENKIRTEAKLAARAQEVAEDRRLMEETLQSLEVKEQRRRADLLAFQEAISKRGENAGKQVLKEAHERAEREERLILELEFRKSMQEQQKLTAMDAAKVKMQREVDDSRRYQLQLQDKVKQENAKEERQFVSDVQAKARHAAYVEKVNMQAKREASLQNQEFVKKQMAEKLERDFLDDINMNTVEKQIMASQLKEAHSTVKHPKHINIF